MRYYDNLSKKFSETYTVDDLYPDYGIEARDDHNAPSLLVLPEGRIMIFYTVHDVKDAFFMKMSTNVEDISTFGKRINIKDPDSSSIQYNYPQPKRLNTGDILLFYRRGSYFNSDEYFKISKDNSKTWGKPIKLTDFGKDGVYAFVYARNNQIHIAWNRSVFNAPPRKIYYIFSPDGGVTWKKRDGTDVALPISEDKAEVVFNAGNEPVYVWDIVVDENNNPFITFAYKNDPSHEFRFAQWNDRSWKTNIITTSSLLYDNENFYSGGVVIDPKNTYKVYLSKKRSRLEIEEWVSFNKGQEWEKAESVTKNSSVDNFRLQVVENYSDNFRLVWSSGLYDGLIDGQWTGYNRVNIQSDVTKNSIPQDTCITSSILKTLREGLDIYK